MKLHQKLITHFNNEEIIEYYLITDDGFQIIFLNYGGIITSILAPDINGNFENIVLSSPDFDPLNPYFLGCITGRVAGRITDAKFTLNGKRYNLRANNGKHNLHSGPLSLDKQIWSVRSIENGAELSYVSPALESGFPAQVKFAVQYIVEKPYELTIRYKAHCDATTILNLTNHSYFDLTAGQDPLRMHLQVPAKYVAEIEKDGCVTGKILAVDNTPFDLEQEKNLSTIIDKKHPELANCGYGFDHPFILNKDQPIFLFDHISKRYLKVDTDDPVCIVYTANVYPKKHAGICLETQKMPNAINWPEYRDSVIYDHDKPYLSTTKWQFGVLPNE